MTSRLKRNTMLVYGLVETFIFSGNILGWAALNYMLKRHGVYRHLCIGPNIIENNGKNFGNITYLPVLERENCNRQDKMLNLAFTVGSFCVGLSAFIWGFLIDKWGLRNVRFLINGFITTGAILLSVTNPGKPYLIFPAITLMCLAGVPLRIANMQVANLFPKHRSTVITLYSGAFSASAAVFILIKYAFDAGLQWQWVCFILVAASCLMFPATMVLFPATKISENGKEEKKFLFGGLSESEISYLMSFGKFSVLPISYISIPASPYSVRKCYGNPVAQEQKKWTVTAGKDNHTQIQCTETDTASIANEPPLKHSLTSFSFFMHQYWFSWLLLTTINYAGSLNLWLERITNNVNNASWYTQVYGLTQISALILAPLGGAIMDRSISSAAKENDPDTRKLKILQSGFWPILLTTITQAAIQICKFFDSIYAVYVSVMFLTILRSLLVAVATAYLRVRFPASHFNRLLGIMSTTAAVFTLLQYPLFIWESRSSEDTLYFNIFNSGMLIIAFVHPSLLMLTKLQRYFIRKENEQLHN